MAEFRDRNVKASKETIAKSLEGTWPAEQLAILKRQLADWDHVQKQMAACAQDLAARLKELPAAEMQPVEAGPPAAGKTGKRQRSKSSKNQPNFNLAGELKRMVRVDLPRIDGIRKMAVQTIISEAGLDMSPLPTENHFVSWLGLAPRNDISGGKVQKKRTRKAVSRLITAMAAKHAPLVYRMLKYGQEYVDKGAAQYEEKYQQQKLKLITKQAAQHGFSLVLLVRQP